MVAKFSARSRLNCTRWALNSASASISLITPDMPLPFYSFRFVTGAFEFGGNLVEAQLHDIRISRDPAGGNVLDPATVRYVDSLVPHDRVDGRGQRRQEPIDLPVRSGTS